MNTVHQLCKFSYNGVDRSVTVEKEWVKGEHIYILGIDAAREEYRTFKFLISEFPNVVKVGLS